MKTPDLASVLAAATLFLALGATGARAQDEAPPPPAPDMPGAAWHAKMLERFDANKDGKLDDAERATARETMSKEMRARLEKSPEFLAKADTNKDGQISDEEWAAAREKFQHIRKQRMDRMEKRSRADFGPDHRGMKDRKSGKWAAMRNPAFRRGYLLGKYDKNNDGKLEPEERAAIKADMEKRIRNRMEKQLARLKAIDTNGDGKISDEEWAAAKARFKERHPGMMREGHPPMSGKGPATPPPPPAE